MKKQKKITILKDVLKVIDKWAKNNKVCFYGDFVSFDKDNGVKEDRLICYGEKKVLNIMQREFGKIYKKEKGKFVNW